VARFRAQAAMWYPMGRPPAHATGVYHALQGAYGQNKVCKQRAHPGDQGWESGTCASMGYSEKIKGTLGAPEFLKRGERLPGY